MSNLLAIAAVTSSLYRMLDTALSDAVPQDLVTDYNLNEIEVTTKPLDKARSADAVANQINIFLFQTTINAALRNMGLPGQVKPGETGPPPLALNLHYLVTAYGYNNDDTAAHIILGHALLAVHDNAVLNPDTIKLALVGNDLYRQVECIRITPLPLSLEEMSRLWATFGTPYRISVAYQVEVVLITSSRPARTPLPVLTRGGMVQANVSLPKPPFAVLMAVTITDCVLHHKRPSAELGDELTLNGYHLAGDTVTALFRHASLAKPKEVLLNTGVTEALVLITLPDTPDDWPAGMYSVSLKVALSGKPDQITNELPFMLAPKVLDTLPVTVIRDGQQRATVNLTCSPPVRKEQRASLLLGNREIQAETFADQTADLKFVVKDAEPGEYPLRLRVDGVDSLLIKDYEAGEMAFDTVKKVIIV